MINLDEKDSGKLLRKAVEIGMRHVEPRIEMAVQASEAYRSQSPILADDDVSLVINHLRPAVEVLLPRIIQSLHESRPYFPIRTRLDTENWRGDIYEDGIDKQMDQGGYKEALTTVIRWMLIYGDAYMMPGWDVWTENRFLSNAILDPLTGELVGEMEEEYEEMQDGLFFEPLPFWAVLVPYMGHNLKTKDYCVVQRVMTIDELLRRIEEDPDNYKLPDDVSKEDLRAKGTDFTDAIDWQARFDQNIARAEGIDSEENLGVMYEFYSSKRWIKSWNGIIQLNPDETPRLTNVDTRMKPLAHAKLNPGEQANQYWGVPIWEWIKDKSLMDTLFMSLLAHKTLMDAGKITAINTDKIDPEDFNGLSYRGVIEVDGPIQDAFQVADFGGTSTTELEIHSIVNGEIGRLTQGAQSELLQGNAPTPKQTARGTEAILGEANINVGSLGQYLRDTFMLELAPLVTSLFARNITFMKFAELVGYDRALSVQTPNPYSIPGGFYFQLEDAQQQQRKQVAFEKLDTFWNMWGQQPEIMNNPPAKMLVMEKYLDHLTEFSREEKDVMLGKDQPVEQMPPEQGEPGMMGGVQSGMPGMPPPQGAATPPAIVPAQQHGTPALTNAAQAEGMAG